MSSKTGSAPNTSQSNDEASDDDDKLVIETPKKRKMKQLQIPESDKKILEVFEQILEDTLDEKAAKTNLKNVHVKNILKHVVTNEHVLAFVKQTENCEVPSLQFEPKFTRAKAKELYSQAPTTTWKTGLSSKEQETETNVLIGGDLREDSSGDEYVPVDVSIDEEPGSEDDVEDSLASESDSISLPATPQSTDCSTQTQTYWTEDGVFKIPQVSQAQVENEGDKTNETKETEEANIARRTRSKLCLSDTALADIEEAFIPPDIPTDMYEMDHECDELGDDNEWRDFLKAFTRPLDEVTNKSQEVEDEEHDPEYNVLADEEIDKVDLEELRADRGVKITRKELNELIAELVDYADNFNNYFPQNTNSNTEKTDDSYVCEAPTNETADYVILDYKQLVMQDSQRILFEQQMRQHVQLLTQHFMLAHLHPEFHPNSVTCRSYLEGLKEFTCDKSFYKQINVESALALVNEWEEKFKCDNPVINDYKIHATKIICEHKQAKLSGTVYIPKFHQLFMKTVSESAVFIYPALLPRIPLTVTGKLIGFSASENELISLGLEQFTPYLKNMEQHCKKDGEVKLRDVSFFINKYMMPGRNTNTLYNHIISYRRAKDSNSIRYYFENNMAPMAFHYVPPLHEFKEIPPCKRNANELPYQWKDFIYPGSTTDSNSVSLCAIPASSSITKVTKPPVYNKKFARRHKTLLNTSTRPNTRSAARNKSVKRKSTEVRTSTSPYKAFVTRDDIFASTPKCKKSLFKLSTPGVKKFDISDKLLKVRFNSSIFEKITDVMLPNMPCLDPQNQKQAENEIEVENNGTETKNTDELEVTSSNLLIDSSEADTILIDSTVNTSEVYEIIVDETTNIKDNLDDINALVLASSTIKSQASSSGKKRPTGIEKKRAKMRRDFTDNLRLLTPEDSDVLSEKRNRFIQAFYDKVQETLDLEDFHRFMAALNDFDEANSSATVLYNQVAEIMGNKHPEIMDEFLLFFDSLQAKTMGKLVPYLMMSNMSLFLRKLEIFFQDQPSQVRKIYRAITDLSTRNDVTMTQVKSTVLPLLKGNVLLTDWFLQIFPMEKPPERLLNGAWENICLNKEKDKDTFETIALPEVEDPYGGPNCICSCHTVEDATFKARSRHCTPCGTKFMQGRVFLQTGRGLRPAKITFDDASVDHKLRLSGSLKPKRAETSPVKISPGKDSQDETRPSSDDEPDKKQQRLLKSANKRKPRKKKDGKTLNASLTALPDSSIHSTSTQRELETEIHEENVVGATPKIVVEHEEQQEWDCNTSVESVEHRMSPEHCPSPSVESESEFCEELETSQDNNSDSDEEKETKEQWTREEDKVILETFQKEEVMDVAFKRIMDRLKGRTLEQVKERFEVLINFLKTLDKSKKLMEDNHILLMRVLKIHYKDRLPILDEALKVIKEYSGKDNTNQTEYKELSNVLEHMLDDLPTEILKYFLTMVPLPKNRELVDLHFNSDESVHAILSEYLNKDLLHVIPVNKIEDCFEDSKKFQETSKYYSSRTSPVKTEIRPRRRMTLCGKRHMHFECKSLVDICADYVIQHETELNQVYIDRKDEAWRLVISNKFTGEQLDELYEYIGDLNKKIQWLHYLEAEEITDEIIRDHCCDEEVLLKESNCEDLLHEETFRVGEKLRKSIMSFLTN